MKLLTSALLASAATLLSAAPALADTLNLTLNTPSITLATGSTYEFDGTVSAPASNTASLFLSDGDNVDPPLTLDDTDFFTLAPLSLNPGQSYTGALFTVTVPTGTAAGTYNGFFDVIGNADPTIVGTQTFSVTTTAATPEPGSWLLLSTGLAGVAALRRRYTRA